MNEIDLIKQYIKRNGLTNKEFAQLIGYDRVSWQKIKSGIVPLNKHFIKNVERAIPDIFLPLKATNVANLPSADEKPHSQKLGALEHLIDKLLLGKYSLIVRKSHNQKLGIGKNSQIKRG